MWGKEISLPPLPCFEAATIMRDFAVWKKKHKPIAVLVLGEERVVLAVTGSGSPLLH